MMIFARQRGMTSQWSIAKLNSDEVIQYFADLVIEWQFMTCGMSRLSYDMKIKLCYSSSRSHQEWWSAARVVNSTDILHPARSREICSMLSAIRFVMLGILLYDVLCLPSLRFPFTSPESHVSSAPTVHLWLCGQKRRTGSAHQFLEDGWWC